MVGAVTESSVSLSWAPPTSPNGVISSYSVRRRSPSSIPSPLLRDVGVAFDGTVIQQFAGTEHRLGGAGNQISLSFRTLSDTGTILYYINQPGTDFIAIELRNGTPWFFFDAGTGPAVIRPDLGGADVRFDDGDWHSISASHSRRQGSIIVDGLYSGSGQSVGLDEVITSSQTLYVGGIPDHIPRSTQAGLTSSDTTLLGHAFAGCMFGVTLNGQVLDFSSSTSVGEAITDLPGCPVNLERGYYHVGGGYRSLASNAITSSRFSLTFDFRTTHSDGLLFFAHSSDGLAVGVDIRNSSLYLVLHDNSSTLRQQIASGDACSGHWNTILLDQSFSEVFLSVNSTGSSLFLSSSSVVFSSSLFFGGVPSSSAAYQVAMAAGMNVRVPFSGCIRDRFPGLLVNGVPVAPENLQLSTSRLVKFDGCYRSGVLDPSTCVQSFSTSQLAGTSVTFNDTSLNPFSGQCSFLALYSCRS